MTEYYLPDIPRLYTALAEWMACLIFILPFKKRFSPAVTGCLVAGAFGIQSVFLISTGGVRLIFWIPCMIFAVFLMVAFVFCCCEIRLTDAAYFGMIAFVAAEFMASAGWQILCYTGKEAWMSWWQQGMAILLIYGVIAVILYKILHIHMPEYLSSFSLSISFSSYMPGKIHHFDEPPEAVGCIHFLSHPSEALHTMIHEYLLIQILDIDLKTNVHYPYFPPD